MKKTMLQTTRFKAVDGDTFGSESISPLALYSDNQPLRVNLQYPPAAMPGYHWHGHMEINIPFDDDVDYIFNGHNVTIKANHITLFWASVPHRVVDCRQCKAMAVLDVPVHLFLSWPLPQDLINHITHGMIIQSLNPDLVSQFEVARWEKELKMPTLSRQQLVYDEIELMIKRIALDGWQLLLEKVYEPNGQQKSSKHTQHYVSLMLDHIASHYSKSLTVSDVASAVGLNTNYAMGLFQSVMQLTIKQYITMMRINHTKALLSDTDKTMLDISLTAGFNSISRFYDNFQKYTGFSPTHYRKMIRSNDKWLSQGFNPTEQPKKGASNGEALIARV
ncbi:transcriptional regulator MelR [Testudinibacter sp. TR-2022]|nr:transcriptional regulator MelR [Pasteurellaceae bacterium Phil31]TNH10935.1 transcriptional regulator MelR [Testudinibacter sp. TR-2022]TNH12302.1 transcriptional regulator MelR [Testudinibacter sp. TR-2022]TNH15040.1 transcriptional regulator MelR [Testudinibacter sp. TR-2022]TNH20515.1 transcriptional regulator MelR [Testudinibacter sp. TR-2022]